MRGTRPSASPPVSRTMLRTSRAMTRVARGCARGSTRPASHAMRRARTPTPYGACRRIWPAATATLPVDPPAGVAAAAAAATAAPSASSSSWSREKTCSTACVSADWLVRCSRCEHRSMDAMRKQHCAASQTCASVRSAPAGPRTQFPSSSSSRTSVASSSNWPVGSKRQAVAAATTLQGSDGRVHATGIV